MVNAPLRWRIQWHKTDSTAGDHDDIEELYARAVDLYSSLTNESSMYPGENYRRLASFLGRPYSGGLMKHLWSGVPPHNPFPFVVLRRHGQQDGASASSTRISFDCGPDGLDAFRATRRISGDMLFLQGTASPEWLNLVGANYGVDPEFFRRHTDSQQPPLYFDLPSLQSSSINIVNLPLTSIGRWGTPMPSHLDLSAERRASKVGSRSVFPPARSTPVGTSIVRQYIILSSEYFAVEQIASVHVHVSKSGSWIGKPSAYFVLPSLRCCWLTFVFQLSSGPTVVVASHRPAPADAGGILVTRCIDPTVPS